MKLDNESRVSASKCLSDTDSNIYQWSLNTVNVVGIGFEQILGLLVYLLRKAASMPPAASKRTSRCIQQGPGESDLIFDHGKKIDDEDEMDFWVICQPRLSSGFPVCVTLLFFVIPAWRCWCPAFLFSFLFFLLCWMPRWAFDYFLFLLLPILLRYFCLLKVQLCFSRPWLYQ